MKTVHSTFMCLISIVFLRKCLGVKTVLNDYIRHYETLSYDITDLHSRHRRAANEGSALRFNILAHGRKFRLKLQNDNSVFSTNHVFEYNGALHNIDTSFLYSGVLIGESGSSVHGSIINGSFRGEIRLPEGTTYHVENADYYFQGDKSFHSVIYNLDDVDVDPYRNLKEADTSSCGLEATYEKMKKFASSAIPTEHSREKRSPSIRSVEDYNNFYNKYSEEANLRRHKRASSSCALPGRKNTCTLYLRTDPVVMEYLTIKGLNYDEVRAKDEIMAMFASHVTAINHIYGHTKFETYDGSTCYTNIQFRVQRTKILTRKSENCDTSSSGPFCNRNLDVSNFLNLNSESDHSDFCLAYIFTRRDFAKGTLGLAWVASTENTRGGVCEKQAKFQESTGEVEKSLNTGVITTVNYQKNVPPRVSQLTLAHEIGHNFGSPHDDGSLCAPFGTNSAAASDGNYIMFASATKGDKKNNNKFSACSKDNITRVIKYVVSGSKNCFIDSGESFCGNGIMEKGEDCDCGFDQAECNGRNDLCCHPKGHKKQCKLKDHATCSPSAGPCCNASCVYIRETERILCKVSTDCANSSFCNGTSSACPDQNQMPDKTLCDDNSMVCQNGLCQGSVCRNIDWTQCFMKADDSDSDYRDKLCYVSCYENKTKTCVSSNDRETVNKFTKFEKLLKKIKPEGGAVKLPPGSPCDAFRGYCDVFSKCRGVDAEGPLARLKNLIFSEETLQTVLAWMQSHWWAMLLISIGVVLAMGLFIAICAVHTPSSNPRKPPARKFDVRNTLRRIRHPGRGGEQNVSNSNPRRPERSHPNEGGDPPPPYYYPSRPDGLGPAPGARSKKPSGQGRNIEMR